jgi:DNA (cytosine-5)-methyltransferase 1
MGSFAVVGEEKAPTLLSRHYKDPSVVTDPSYGVGRDAYNQGQNAKFTPTIEKELQPTLVAKGPGAVASPYGFDPSASRDLGQYFLEDCGNTLVNGTCPGHHNGVLENGYTVRRLTPTECARLQGFPDWWCRGLNTPNPSEEDVKFWTEVWNTYATVIGGCKPKTEKQVRKWLEHPHSDAAEYKLWGNGVALPCVFFVLSGIVYYTQNDG